MTSAKDDDSSNTCESFGTIMGDIFQEHMPNNFENTAQTAISDTQGSMNDIDNMIVPVIIDNSNTTNGNDTSVTCEPTVVEAATSVIQASDTLENRLSSVYLENHILSENRHNQNTTQTQSSTLIYQLQVQSSNTSDRTEQVDSLSERHIMISYHHDSSFQICRRIRDRLRERGYRIWMDANDLHGSIHQGMAEAVERSSIVLFCINQQYFCSEFCRKEVLYTDKIHVEFIPCLMESQYRPQGWLGIIIGDQMYIDFSESNNFDNAFEELVAEIQAIEERLKRSSTIHSSSSLTNSFHGTEMLNSFIPDIAVNNQSQHATLRTIIQDFRESINRSNQTEEEFLQFVDYIRRRVSIDTTTITRNEQSASREILEEILQHSRNQTEFLQRITNILSSITETKTIIKLSLAFALFWTFNKFLHR